MLTEVSPTKYAVKINGVIISQPFFAPEAAQHYIFNLPRDQQVLAEVVIVDCYGKELLLG